MKAVADEVSRKDYEKANNRLKVLGIAGGVAASIVAVLGSIIGSNFIASKNEGPNDNE